MGALKPGQLVAGRYLLESEIGAGAMGAVFRAQDQTLKRQVAIKFLFVRAARDPQAMVDQFLREARIAASVQHRNVIHTVDFGTVDQFQPFMVMELLNGESLGDRMHREPALTSEQFVHLVSLTLRGLAAVHDAGIVHRDLKPQNVFLQRDADAVYPKILDFGISRSLENPGDRPSAIATQEGLIVGTPDYMSPEQASGEAQIDKRSDIYSMGVILYEGLTGQLPFAANTVGELIVKVMTQTPPRMSEVAPELPESLCELVETAMARDRARRFPDARAMRKALLSAVERALPQPRRVAGSVPPEPVTRPISAPLRPAPSTTAGAATWGDFEGLNAPQLVDSLPPPGTAPPLVAPAPQQQRMVATVASSPSPNGLANDNAPALRGGASSGTAKRAQLAPPAQIAPARPQASAARASKAEAAGDDALDPLYAGAEQAAPDLDYGKIDAAATVQQQRRAAGVVGTVRRGQRMREVRAEAAPAAVRRSRAKVGLSWLWLLPIAAIAAAGLWFVGIVPTSAAAPSADVSPEAPAADPRTAEGVRHMVKARRKNAGAAPAHLRDVVF